MRMNSQPVDPAIHESARRIAYRFVYIIQAILRDEERIEAQREAYDVAVQELEAFKKAGA
jgi:hypothetical protein